MIFLGTHEAAGVEGGLAAYTLPGFPSAGDRRVAE